ncbi:uncharacterized protein UTRI_02187 [Ustilago trichophora]|uniref:SAGA-associated factor 11 n=1 Tax=Ustilago trichophora TaxID=86804 RepID=A0A5C3DZ60_9BASI|nr:uncharacterized protein UTRI_02187 [Ustilago trichophora]
MANDPKALIAAKFLDSFLREIVLDTALTTHTNIKRARSICHLCGTRCQAHTPAAEQSILSATLDISSKPATPGSRSGTPAPGGSGSTSSKPDYYSNNPLFECLVCSRQVSSNRYATHLAKCMGMGSKGGRKGAARNAKATTAGVASLAARSGAGTPRYGSDLDDDSFAKRKNGVNAKNGTKRANSPLAASTLANARMNKRIKTSSPTPPPSDSGVGMNRSYSSQTFAPSALGTSTVLSGSPLNPNNNNNASSSTTTTTTKSSSKLNGSSKLKHDSSSSSSSTKKRKRFIDDDEEDDAGGKRSYDGQSASEADSNGEEGEISDDDDDDDVALAAGSRPPSSSTKIKLPIRSTPTTSCSFSKPKTFIIADDSDEDSDTNLSARRKTNPASDDDDDEDDDDDDDDDDEHDDNDDDDDEDDEEDDDLQVTRVTHSSNAGGARAKKKKPSTTPSATNSGGLQRERGSDGEFIDVESASEQSDADSF